MTEKEWEVECKRRIHVMTCALYTKQGLTISQAQSILGDYADADGLFKFMLEKKDLMISPIDDNTKKHEYTHQGLSAFFAGMLPQAQEYYHTDKLEDTEFLKFIMRESARVVREFDGKKRSVAS